jgi:BirA family transcriptional regulator, biotin operon repressor / biotin---[acetyl-CoA-carboxylase] ligase
VVLTRDDLREALAAIHVTASVRADEVTPSTNATAGAMAEAGDPEWTMVAAAHQTDGRGRLGRSWVDVTGRALMFSFVLRPALEPTRAGLLSLLAGASMAGAIREKSGRTAWCKWPNDLLLREGKVGGVLLESSVAEGRLRYVVVGIGVNLEPPPEVEGSAGLGELAMRDLLAAFLVRFYRTYRTTDASGFGERVRGDWLPVSSTIGSLVEATTVSGERLVGRAVGVDDFGGLLLSTDAGEARVAFGEVEHLEG